MSILTEETANYFANDGSPFDHINDINDLMPSNTFPEDEEKLTYRVFFTDEDYNLHLGNSSWTKDDTLRLTELVRALDFNWEEVAKSFQHVSRTPECCQQRYQVLIDLVTKQNLQLLENSDDSGDSSDTSLSPESSLFYSLPEGIDSSPYLSQNQSESEMVMDSGTAAVGVNAGNMGVGETEFMAGFGFNTGMELMNGTNGALFNLTTPGMDICNMHMMGPGWDSSMQGINMEQFFLSHLIPASQALATVPDTKKAKTEKKSSSKSKRKSTDRERDKKKERKKKRERTKDKSSSSSSSSKSKAKPKEKPEPVKDKQKELEELARFSICRPMPVLSPKMIYPMIVPKLMPIQPAPPFNPAMLTAGMSGQFAASFPPSGANGTVPTLPSSSASPAPNPNPTTGATAAAPSASLALTPSTSASPSSPSNCTALPGSPTSAATNGLKFQPILASAPAAPASLPGMTASMPVPSSSLQNLSSVNSAGILPSGTNGVMPSIAVKPEFVGTSGIPCAPAGALSFPISVIPRTPGVPSPVNNVKRKKGKGDASDLISTGSSASGDGKGDPNGPPAGPPKKRKRRTAAEIERKFKCEMPNCTKAYGSEGALKMHIKLKHPGVKQPNMKNGHTQPHGRITNPQLPLLLNLAQFPFPIPGVVMPHQAHLYPPPTPTSSPTSSTPASTAPSLISNPSSPDSLTNSPSSPPNSSPVAPTPSPCSPVNPPTPLLPSSAGIHNPSLHPSPILPATAGIPHMLYTQLLSQGTFLSAFPQVQAEPSLNVNTRSETTSKNSDNSNGQASISSEADSLSSTNNNCANGDNPTDAISIATACCENTTTDNNSDVGECNSQTMTGDVAQESNEGDASSNNPTLIILNTDMSAATNDEILSLPAPLLMDEEATMNIHMNIDMNLSNSPYLGMHSFDMTPASSFYSPMNFGEELHLATTDVHNSEEVADDAFHPDNFLSSFSLSPSSPKEEQEE